MRASHRHVLALAAVAAALTLPLATPEGAKAAYGAIAVDEHTGAWGMSYGRPTKRGAKRQALRACGGDCRIMVWVQRRCGAVVKGPIRYVAGMGTTRRRALSSARRRARDPDARRVAWVCSG